MQTRKEIAFSIIIPNYNNARYLKDCINSILNQTYECFKVIVVDDASTDDSIEVINKIKDENGRVVCISLGSMGKRFNGGARNVGVRLMKSVFPNYLCNYTMFLDSDDMFVTNTALETIKNIILENNYPDCVSLSYIWEDGSSRAVTLDRKTPQELMKHTDVACWTKCIKSELIVPFPENTLMEDTVQHIRQCDKLKTVVPCYEAIVRYNRQNPFAVTSNKSPIRNKYESSRYRLVADLKDLYWELENDWAKEFCKSRTKSLMEELKNIIINELGE